MEILRARLITGKTLRFRDVALDDAPFILSLRTDPSKGRYISKVENDLGRQQDWIRNYLLSTGQAYFIITDCQGAALGTVRLYNGRGNSFSWGSWVLKAGVPQAAAIESALMVYRYATGTLGFSGAHFEVDRQNTSVWAFHERFGAHRVAESDREFFYEIEGESIQLALLKYARFLPHQLVVEKWQI